MSNNNNQFVIVICCQCWYVIDLKFWYVNDPDSPVEESHGYCEECANKLMGNL